MASPTFYATGTVSVANGATTVTGVGTAWDGKVYPGDLFADPAQPLVPPQRIASVTDDTHLVLWANWPGTTIAAGAYEVRITPDSARVQERTRQVLEALASAANVGFDPPVGMTADDVQEALEELFGEIDGAAPQATTYTKTETDTLVSTAAAGVASRGTVRAATTANITIATALNNGDSLDGATLATGDLVLVKNQAAPAENGIYVVGTSPTRAAQFDTYDEHPGSLIVVQEGTANADTFWYCTSNKGGTLGSTAIAFAQLSLAPPDGSITYAKMAAGVIREKLTANRTYYVRSDGSDSNTGLANTSGGAFATIQKAWDTILALDLNSFTATISLGSGTFTAGLNANYSPLGGRVAIVGAGSANTTVNTTGGDAFALSAAAHVTFSALRIQTTTSGNAINAQAAGVIVSIGSDVVFGATAGWPLRIVNNAYVAATAGFTFAGSAQGWIIAQSGGILELSSLTLTFTGTPAWANAGIVFDTTAVVSLFSVTMSGSATGKRFAGTTGGQLNSFGAGSASTYFPGNSNGTTATGANQG